MGVCTARHWGKNERNGRCGPRKRPVEAEFEARGIADGPACGLTVPGSPDFREGLEYREVVITKGIFSKEFIEIYNPVECTVC